MAMPGDFNPTASLKNLRRRAEMLARLRGFFHARGFLEVDTPTLSADTVIDRHVDPVAVTLPNDPTTPSVGRDLWLQTSPEFCMKRLLAAGAQAIFQVTHAFRVGETGPLHNPEFTIAEWYRVGDDMQSAIELLADLTEQLLPFDRPEKMSYRMVFEQQMGIDPHTASATELGDTARAHAISIPSGHDPSDRDAWLDLLLVERVSPRLGIERPVIVYDYPESQSALAKVRPGLPAVAERFELFAKGIELANGYHELLDADELAERNRRINLQRQDDGKPTLPEESRLIDAMRCGLPPCAGVALGFDRLVMLGLGATSINDVIAFPVDRA